MPEVDRRAASQAAVQARRARAEVKKAVYEGQRSPVDVLTVASIDPVSAEATMRVTDFLKSLRGIGATKIPNILTSLDISEKKRLGGLGHHQQSMLRNWLIKRARARREEWPPTAIVLAGPTAVGKGTVASHIKQNYPDVHLSISATTREPRPGEIDGVHYFFVDHAEFDSMIARGALLEWAVVHGQNKYGTPRRPIEIALASGKPVLFEIDLQGARQIRKSMPEARHVFLLPPSWDELVRRLENRGTESYDERERRLQTARDELAAQKEFDVRIVNVEVSEAAKQVVELMGLTEE